MYFGLVYTNINLNHYTMKNVPLFKGSLKYCLCLFLVFNLSCSSDDEISDIPVSSPNKLRFKSGENCGIIDM